MLKAGAGIGMILVPAPVKGYKDMTIEKQWY